MSRTSSASPRSYQQHASSSTTPIPAERASTNESRRLKTKLMSVRNGLVGSIASGTPSSLARAAAGAIRSQNSSAASSHVREPMLPVVHHTESAPTAAAKSSASPSTRSSVPMFDTRRPASANTAGSQPIASSFGEMAPMLVTPSSRKNPSSSGTGIAPAHSSLTEMRGCADTRESTGQRGPVIWSITRAQARPSAKVGMPGDAVPALTASRTSFAHGSISV